jgi:hypothetical protein
MFPASAEGFSFFLLTAPFEGLHLKRRSMIVQRKNLAWGSSREQNDVEKSKKIQARNMTTKHSVFTAMKNMDLNQRTGLCARGASCGLTDRENQLEQFTFDMCRNCL